MLKPSIRGTLIKGPHNNLHIAVIPVPQTCGIEPESSDVAFQYLGEFAKAKKSLDAGLRISGMTDKEYNFETFYGYRKNKLFRNIGSMLIGLG